VANYILKIFLLLNLAWLAIPQQGISQIPTNVFEITSILVDACSTVEGENEMVEFQIGPNPININTLRVDGAGSTGSIQNSKWPNTSNLWLGIAPSPAKPTQVAQINASIVNCGKLIEPVGGILPAGKKVILVTSTNFDPTANSFTQLSDTIYIIFQNSGNTAGHFVNYASGTSNRTLRLMHVPSGQNDVVVYDKSQLVDAMGVHTAADGAGVRYTFSGTPSYYNNGCQAPFVPLDASWTCPASICQSDNPINLNSLITGNTGGSWSGNGVNGNLFDPSGLSGSITITYSVGNSPCNVSESHTIQVIASGDANWNAPQNLCQNSNPINLNTFVSGTTGGNWAGLGVTGSTFNPNGLNGIVIITYTVGNGNCVDIKKDTIEILQTADANWLNPGPVCAENLPINLDNLISGTQGGTWSGNGVNANIFDQIANTYSYDVWYKVGSGSCADSMMQTIDIDQLVADFTATPSTGSAPLIVDLTNQSVGSTQLFWTASNGDNSQLDPCQFTFNTIGTYTIQLKVSSANNCWDSITKIIKVEDSLTMLIPNVFTPNSDGKNDKFYTVINGELEDYKMLIFNRWGKIIFESSDQNEAWEGQYEGTEIPDGVYFYRLNYRPKGSDSKEDYKTGSITLYR
jgi:gliding motility-associated-like protein